MKSNNLCPRCWDKPNHVVVNNDLNCFTCNGPGIITDEHRNLFELGFEETTCWGEYELFYYKRTRNEEFRIWVTRDLGVLQIVEIRFWSYYTGGYALKLNSVQRLISYLKSFEQKVA